MKQHKRSGEDRERSRAGGLDELNRVVENRMVLDRLPYDGVRGQPPHWLPSPLVDEFGAARDKLLRRYSVKQITTFLVACGDLGVYPFETVREVEALLYIKQLVDLGEIDGIDTYLGRGRYRLRRAYVEDAQRPDEIIAAHEGEQANRASVLGGENAASARRLKNSDRDKEILKEAERLRAKGKMDRSIPTMLENKKKWENAKGGSLSRKQIARIIKRSSG